MPSRLMSLTAGPDILVGRALVVVGRDPFCDVRIPSARVSRRHCCLVETAGEVEVRDLGSTNGVRINGRLVDSGRMRPGDVLSVAQVRYRLEGDPAGVADQTVLHRRPEAAGGLTAALD